MLVPPLHTAPPPQQLCPSAVARYAALTSPLPAAEFLVKQAQGELPPSALPGGAAGESGSSSHGASQPPEDGEQLGLLAIIAATNSQRELALAALSGLKALRSPTMRARVYTEVADALLTQVRVRSRAPNPQVPHVAPACAAGGPDG